MRLKLFFVLIIFFVISKESRGDHLMGGEVTWECISTGPDTGKFVFNMKIYRDCNGINLATTGIVLHSNSPVGNIPMNFISRKDVSPVCKNDPSLPHITCAGADGDDIGAVEEFVFQSNPIVINGIPPANGWTFWWNSCCRNMAVTNLDNPSSHGYTLRAKMYPYNGKNTYPCYDSSPVFYELPKTVICTGYKFTFNHNAVDVDLDSLAYSWAEPLDGTNPPTGPPLVFKPGYSYTNPLPDQSENPNNEGASINSLNGEISFKSFTPGAFVVVNSVKAYKCGILIAEIFRDIQIVLKNCDPIIAGSPPIYNNPPIVQPPFVDSGVPVYEINVYAGNSICFPINITDADINSTFQFQDLHMEPSGQQLSNDFTNKDSCLRPPCATVSPNPISTTGQINLAFQFCWDVTCDHIRKDTACRIFTNVYNYVFKVFDDFCPIPGLNVLTVTIVVLAPPVAQPPDMKCASVGSSGDVTINWKPGIDSANSFHAWYVYRSLNKNGPYALVDSVLDKTKTFYVDTNADGNANSYFYYMRVSSGCDNYELPNVDTSDYIQTIKLDVTNTGTGFAQLTWNSTHDPLIASNALQYKIYRKAQGVWDPNPLKSVTAVAGTMSTTDSIVICNDSLSYRVEVTDAVGNCTSVSNVDGDLFQDILPPFIPSMNNVSVDMVSSNATISWTPSSSPDVVCYIIMQEIGGNWQPIDTVWGVTASSTATQVNAELASRTFRVLAADSCWNLSAMNDPHRTIFLDPKLDPCEATIQLNWNSYINWPGTVQYSVYRSENGGAPILLTTTTDSTYLDASLTQFNSYRYYIVAKDASLPAVKGTSFSNDSSLYADIPRKPEYCYIISASVTGPDEVRLKVHIDVAADVREYRVMRAEKYSGPYLRVGTIPYSATTPITFTDNTAMTGLRSYYYRIVVIDTCGIEAKTSDIGKTIFVSVSRNDDVSNTIRWNEYEVWLGGVGSYNLYRSIDGDIPTLLATIAPGNTEYLDNVVQYVYTSEGQFCYYIEALEGGGNTYGFRDTSLSNFACTAQKPLVFIPNAINPSSKSIDNAEFNPSKYFIDSETYSMSIYNRFGEQVFSTNNTRQGWNGTYKGEPVPGGVYVYLLKVKATDGTNIERKGTLTLIR